MLADSQDRPRRNSQHRRRNGDKVLCTVPEAMDSTQSIQTTERRGTCSLKGGPKNKEKINHKKMKRQPGRDTESKGLERRGRQCQVHTSTTRACTVELCLPPSLLPSEEKEGERSSSRVLNLLSLSFSPSRTPNADATYSATALTPSQPTYLRLATRPPSTPDTDHSPPPLTRALTWLLPPDTLRSLPTPHASHLRQLHTRHPALPLTASELLDRQRSAASETARLGRLHEHRRRPCQQHNTHAYDVVRLREPPHP